MNNSLKCCPFAVEKQRLYVVMTKEKSTNDNYANDPWNGLWYQIRHSHEENEGCPIARYAEDNTAIGTYTYNTREEAVEAWNRRTNNDNLH